MANTDPAKTYRITDFIDMKDNDEFTYDKLAIYMRSMNDDRIIYSSDNSIYTYLPELKNATVWYTFSDEEYLKYKFRPKLLAYDIYGATELYFIILAVNDMCNIKDFKKHKIRLFFKSDLNDLLSQITSAEKYRLSLNRKILNENALNLE